MKKIILIMLATFWMIACKKESTNVQAADQPISVRVQAHATNINIPMQGHIKIFIRENQAWQFDFNDITRTSTGLDTLIVLIKGKSRIEISLNSGSHIEYKLIMGTDYLKEYNQKLIQDITQF